MVACRDIECDHAIIVDLNWDTECVIGSHSGEVVELVITGYGPFTFPLDVGREVAGISDAPSGM